MLFLHQILLEVHEVTMQVVVSAIIVSAIGRVIVDEVAELAKPPARKKSRK